MRAILSLFALLVLAAGCAAPEPATGHSRAVIEAEAILASTHSLADSFLRWEHQNRQHVGSDVTEAADIVRLEFPAAHDSATAALRTYKRYRTTENYEAFALALTVLNSVMVEINRHYTP